MDKQTEIKQLLTLYQLKCFSLFCTCDDTEIEDEIFKSMKNIEERILELAKDSICEKQNPMSLVHSPEMPTNAENQK